MRKQKCLWNRCRDIIEVDERYDIDGFAQAGGFCDLHSKAYRKKVELFIKKFGMDRWVEEMNKLWRDNRKEYKKIEKKAVELVTK